MKKNKVSARGFTLIELLVVIAIIGILAGIILVSLNSARTKAKDAAVKADLAGIRTAMEVYYTDNNSYGAASTSCDDEIFATSNVAPYIDGIRSNGGTASCETDGALYAVSTTLPSAPTTFWCVDSAGYNASTTAANPGTNACQ